MPRCEDWPCCGHEPGECPDYDRKGNVIRKCAGCQARIPVNSRYSLCQGCMDRMDHERMMEENGYHETEGW